MLAFGERSQLVLGSSQMLTWFLTRFLAWFSQWELIDTFTCEKWIENWSQVFIWMKTNYENWFKFIHFIFLAATIGSSCSSSHSGLLLFSCCSFLVIFLLLLLFFLLLLLFFLYWYYDRSRRLWEFSLNN
jgi:hypothetical protein